MFFAKSPQEGKTKGRGLPRRPNFSKRLNRHSQSPGPVCPMPSPVPPCTEGERLCADCLCLRFGPFRRGPGRSSALPQFWQKSWPPTAGTPWLRCPGQRKQGARRCRGALGTRERSQVTGHAFPSLDHDQLGAAPIPSLQVPLESSCFCTGHRTWHCQGGELYHLLAWSTSLSLPESILVVSCVPVKEWGATIPQSQNCH